MRSVIPLGKPRCTLKQWQCPDPKCITKIEWPSQKKIQKENSKLTSKELKKPCDKCGGIIICYYVKYVEPCNKDLQSKTINWEPYYKKIILGIFEKAKKEIDKMLKKHLTQNISQKKHLKKWEQKREAQVIVLFV
jgi:hypothetical protein